MSKKEGLQKEIDKIDRIAKFTQNLILALISALVWSVYAILENKVDYKIIILSGVGVIVLIFLTFFWIHKNKEQDELIQKLYKEE